MKRTCTTMIYTDGTKSVFAVMQGRMKGRAFDAHSAEIVARYAFYNGTFPSDATYRAMTKCHATADAPAVYWQA